MNNKYKSYSFWMSVTAAVILVINNVGKVCGFSIDSKIVTQIVDSVCGVLILFGIITISKTEKDEKENFGQDTDEQVEDIKENEKEVKSQISSKINDKITNKKTNDKELQDTQQK